MGRKSFKVDEADYKLLQIIKNVNEEDKQRNRLISIETNTRRAKHIQRAIDYKNNQLKEGESLEKHEHTLDGKKPLYIIENEIEESLAQIKQLEEANKFTQEEYNKNK